MEYNEFEGKLLGSTIKIALYDTPKQVSDIIFPEVYLEALRLQKIFNLYDKESELSLLNKTKKQQVSPELLEVIKKALEYCKKTNGEYDISLGKQIIERKSKKQLSKQNYSYKEIIIKGNEVTLSNPEIIIDLGSIAKGYITDNLAEFIESKGIVSFFIDARGDMLSRGGYGEEVTIQHPREKEKTLNPIKIKNEAIATSGDYNQFYGSYDKSHIINQKDLISVSVIANNLMDADVFASAVFLLNKKEREELIKANPKFKVQTIDKELNENFYNGFPAFSNRKEVKDDN